MQTLFFHHGALGDSVLLWPLLRVLGDVSFVTAWGKAKLAAHRLENIRAVSDESPELTRLHGPGLEAERFDRIRMLLGDADRVISFVSDGADAWAQNVRRLYPNASFDFLPTRPPPGSTDHVLDFWARRLNVAPIQLPARSIPAGPIVIHPGSGGVAKCWPPERFDALLDRLNNAQRSVTLLLGEVEREKLDPRWPQHWSKKCHVVEPKDYIELADQLSRASLYIGNDSGPTHLAAQLGVPTLALFGPTDPKVWSPTGPQVRVLAPPRPAPMSWLDVENVMQTIAQHDG